MKIFKTRQKAKKINKKNKILKIIMKINNNFQQK